MKDLHLSRLHVGRTKKQFDDRLLAHAFEVDGLPEQFLKRAEIERIHLVGRRKVSQENEAKRMHKG
jgi:hypothetical protein